jgi:hypothetical protein
MTITITKSDIYAFAISATALVGRRLDDYAGIAATEDNQAILEAYLCAAVVEAQAKIRKRLKSSSDLLMSITGTSVTVEIKDELRVDDAVTNLISAEVKQYCSHYVVGAWLMGIPAAKEQSDNYIAIAGDYLNQVAAAVLQRSVFELSDDDYEDSISEEEQESSSEGGGAADFSERADEEEQESSSEGGSAADFSERADEEEQESTSEGGSAADFSERAEEEEQESTSEGGSAADFSERADETEQESTSEGGSAADFSERAEEEEQESTSEGGGAADFSERAEEEEQESSSEGGSAADFSERADETEQESTSEGGGADYEDRQDESADEALTGGGTLYEDREEETQEGDEAQDGAADWGVRNNDVVFTRPELGCGRRYDREVRGADGVIRDANGRPLTYND